MKRRRSSENFRGRWKSIQKVDTLMTCEEILQLKNPLKISKPLETKKKGIPEIQLPVSKCTSNLGGRREVRADPSFNNVRDMYHEITL